ncbi:MAG: hypothetical protein ACKO37_01825 [Vampirovibrionales bacterium]
MMMREMSLQQAQGAFNQLPQMVEQDEVILVTNNQQPALAIVEPNLFQHLSMMSGFIFSDEKRTQEFQGFVEETVKRFEAEMAAAGQG